MRLVLAIAALAAFLVVMFGSGQAPARTPAAATAAARLSAAHPRVHPAPQAPAPTPSPMPPTPPTAAALPATALLHAVEASVHAARMRGAGENEIHRLRASRLTAAQLESLLAMESAESQWRQRIADLRQRCGSSEACGTRLPPAEQPRWRSYAAPALRQ